MRGSRVKLLRRAAARLHLRLLVDGKIEKPDTVEMARAQLKWLERRLKNNWKKLSEPERSNWSASTRNSIDSAWPDEKSTGTSTEPVVL